MCVKENVTNGRLNKICKRQCERDGLERMEEVFLPYRQDRQGVTFFERMEKQDFLLESGKS